jgi:flagellar biogenesis protein FliO
MFEEEVTLTFIFQTIAVILLFTAIGIYFVKKYEKKR